MVKSCNNCYFVDVCSRSRPCNLFAPLLDEDYFEENELQNKEEYYQAWLEYIKDFD